MTDRERVVARGTPTGEEFRLVVAVGDAEAVPQLMRTAAAVARFEGGSVHVVSVVHKPYRSEFGVFDDETIRERYAGDRVEALDRAVDAGRDAGVDVTGSVVVARHVADGLIEAAEAAAADAVLVGWDLPARARRATPGSVVDGVLERSPVDVLVERIGTTADGVESVLVPVAGSPHAALAARVAGAIAAANGAKLVLMAVATPDVDRATAETWVADTEAAFADLWEGADRLDPARLSVHGVVVESDDVAGAIAVEASGHDVVLMGATRGGALRRRLLGSNATAVAEQTDATLLLTQQATASSRLLRGLGRLRRS